MGLKTSNYEVKEMGTILPEAYAQITYLSIDLNGDASVVFEVQQNRENITKKKPFETIRYGTQIDKDMPIYAQIYTKAKESIFKNWEDDIVEVEE